LAIFPLKTHDADPSLPTNICWGDECTIHLNGRINRQNRRYYSTSNPHWFSDSKAQNSPKVNVWAGIYNNQMIGPFFIDGNINGDNYYDMLINEVLPAIDAAGGNLPVWYMQDGAPAHFKRNVRDLLDDAFPGMWIGRQGPIEWPPRSPDLTPLDFFLWGYIRHRIFTVPPVDIDDLKAKIIFECQNVPRHMFENCMRGFYDRLGYCLVSEGKHFEHKL